MRGGLTLKIFQILGKTALATGDIIEAILSSPYGASAGQMERNLRESKKSRARGEVSRLECQKYYNVLYWLKKDRLIKANPKGLLSITSRGRKKLETLIRRQKLSLPAKVYLVENTKQVIIVAFDIPERERHKRDWLRVVLRGMGLQMIQKSLWFGKKKLPAKFLEDLKNLKLLGCVEIFEINHSGTLRHVA